MRKHSPLLLASGLAVALFSGCSKNDADNADTAAVTPPPRPAKAVPATPATPGVPGMGAATAGQAGAAAPGKKDPFKPAGKAPGANKPVGGKMAGGKAGAPGKPTAAPGSPLGGPAPAQAAQAGMPGVPPAPGAPPSAGAPGAAPVKVAAVPKSIRDPFKIDWHKQPPPPYIFDEVNAQPLRIASADVETPPVGNVAVREVANRRVSGIMSGDGVFAILEQAGDTEIVKPGSQTKDGYRVVSITEDSVKLQRKDGNIVRTQIVPLTDQSTGGPTGGTGMFGGGQAGFPGSGGRMPGMPGSGGRAPGMPGRGRGRGPGGGGGAPGVGAD